jgi:hypothetical protein
MNTQTTLNEVHATETITMIEGAARVMRGYRGTRLYGALRSAGLGEILLHDDLYVAAARLAAR